MRCDPSASSRASCAGLRSLGHAGDAGREQSPGLIPDARTPGSMNQPSACLPEGRAIWFGPQTRSLCGVVHRPRLPGSGRGLVICPPIGYELWSSYATLRSLARDACDAGLTVLRFDYDGTGDSVGDHLDAHRVQAWLQSIDHACRHLVDAWGVHKLSLLGLRLGASLAATYAAQTQPAWLDELILWDPVVNGRRYVRGLQLMAAPDPGEPAAAHAGGTAAPASPRTEVGLPDAALGSEGDAGLTSVAGTVHSASTLADLAALNLLKLDAPTCKVLLLHRPERSDCATLAQHWTSAGARVEAHADGSIEKVIDRAAEEAELPTPMLELLRIRFAGSADGGAATPLVGVPPRELARLRRALADAELVERFVRIEPDGLHGVLCEAADRHDPDKLLVFLNAGLEHHVGPGRLWVEFSRALARPGLAALRVDFNGLGESPLRVPGRALRLYDLAHEVDIGNIVRFARQRGYRKVVLLGLCASAWIALHSAAAAGADAVAAINPQLYWRPGDPTPIALAQFRKPGAARREALGARWGLWSLLDFMGLRPHAARWLQRLRRNGVAILMLYAESDPGVIYLRTRMARGLARLTARMGVRCVEVPGLDHPMHRHALRPRALAVLRDFVESL